MNDAEPVRAGPDVHRGPAHNSPYPLSRLAPPHDLVDVAREIQRADAVIAHVTSEKLELIAEQIRGLQQRAREVLAAAEFDAELHRARCAFQKRVGRAYHLYRAHDGSAYFSMLSPDDWNGTPPDTFAGTYRLEADMGFSKVVDANAPDRSAR